MLVGRESEQRLLERLVSGARVGTSGVLLVTGDAGVGKSALLDHAAGLAAGMTLARVAGSAPEQEIPFAGLQQLLRAATRLLDRIPRRQADALGAALALSAGTVADRFTVGAATLSLLCRYAEERPLAVLVDDAHWLDVASAEALAFAARRLLADPVVVLIAAREGVAAEPIREGLPRLRLSGLDPRATRELLARRYAGPVTDAAVHRLQRVTGGNPLAILELAEGLLAEGPSPAAPVAVSVALAEGFAGRAAGLAEPARRALLLAATEGGRTRIVLEAVRVCGGGPNDLVEAEAAGLIAVTADRITFRHPLVRSAVYTQAPAAQRREAHRAVAAAIARCGPGAGDEEDRRAWHLAEAALGPDPEVVDLLESVATRATRRGAHAAAARALEGAARLSPTDAAAAPRFVDAAQAARLAGRDHHAATLLDEADSRALDPRHRVAALALRGAVAAQHGSLLESRDLFLAAADLLESAETGGDAGPAITVLADALQSTFYLADGPAAAAIAHRIERLVPLAADAGIRDFGTLAAGIARVLAGEGGTGQIREAVASLTDSRALLGDPLHLGWLALGPLWLREAGTGRELLQRVASEVRERGAIATLPFLLFLLGRDDATRDQWAAAEASYSEGIRLARETGRVPDLVASLAGLAWLEARQGRAEPCREHAAEALRESLPRHLNLFRVWALFALGDLELGAGRPAAALGHFEELRAVLVDGRFADVDLSPVPELAEVRLRLGGADGLADDAQRLLRQAQAKGQPWALARAHRGVALTSTGAAVERHFRESLDHHGQTLDAFETARTRLLYGAWLRRDRRRARSRPVLREALESFERLGAVAWADVAAAELAATGQTVHRREADTLDELTPQQLQIARLLASGSTSREAAAAVFVSRKTVEYHLRNIYLKLGISSREELAEAMRR